MSGNNRNHGNRKPSVKSTPSTESVEKVVEVEAPKELELNETSKKEMNATVFSGLIGLNEGAKLWVSKKFKETEIKTAGEWCKIFLKEGAIDEVPNILK